MTARQRIVAAALLLAPLLVGCGGSSSPTSSGTELSVQIQVPRQVNLTESGSETVTFTSQVEGSAESLTWEMTQDHFDGERPDWTEIGQGATLEHRFSKMGTYRVRLMARSADGDLEIKGATTAVLPYLEDPEPILFFSYGEDGQVSLMRMSPETPQGASVIASGPDFHASSLDKSPDGRLVVTGLQQGARTRNLVIFDLQAGEVVRQITDTDFISWDPAWSPDGEWIAYVDDSRIQNQASDEVALVRPDGTDRRYLSGAEPQETYWGFPVSWNPDGRELALGKARFSGEEFRRIAIIDEPWTEQPPRRRLHTEETIQSNVENYERYRLEGGTGLDWSPDGGKIAFSVTYGTGISGISLGIASADGSGPITILPYGAAYSPSWSPEGNHIVFELRLGGTSHLVMVNSDGRNPVDLSRLRTSDGSADDVTPVWN